MSKKLTLLEHLRSTAESAKAFTNKLILQLTETTIAAIEEVAEQSTLNSAALTETVNAGRKNLIDTSKLPASSRYGGITCTNNGDGSLTLQGKYDGDSTIILIGNINAGVIGTTGQVQGHSLDDEGVYIADLGVSNNSVSLQVCKANEDKTPVKLASTHDNGTFKTVEVNYTEPAMYTFFRIGISAHADFTEPLTIRPMVCKKALYDIDPTFRPYVLSNAELAQRIAVLESRLSAMGVNGALAAENVQAENEYNTLPVPEIADTPVIFEKHVETEKEVTSDE